MRYRNLFFFIGILIVILLDLLSKKNAFLYLNSKEIHILYDYITFNLTYNTGIAFSFPIEGIILKIITIVLISIIVFYYFYEEYKKNNNLLDLSFILILGGAIGNGYERVFNGKVIDFISVKYFSVFNFADSFIFIGVVLYLITEFLPGINKKNNGTFGKGKRNSILTK